MKNLILLFHVIVFFTAGAITTSLFGFNPIAGGSVTLVLGSAVKLQPGILATGFDISEVVAQLGAYSRKYEKQIWRAVVSGIEFEKYMRKVPNIQSQYVATSSSHTEFLQAKQSGWQPKGQVNFHARINKVFQIKIDTLIQDMHEIYDSWLSFLVAEEKSPTEQPLVKYIIYNHMVPAIQEEIAELSVNGEYVAPTPGVAGPSINSADGMKKIIADEITATNLAPLTTGVLVQADIIDQVESFYDQLPKNYKKIGEPIFCAPEIVTMYCRAYRDKYGGNQDYKGQWDGPTIDGTSKKLLGVPEWTGSQRLLHTTKGNLLCMYDKIYTPNSFDIQKEKRDVLILGDFKRGWGIANLEEMFVNDQA